MSICLKFGCCLRRVRSRLSRLFSGYLGLEYPGSCKTNHSQDEEVTRLVTTERVRSKNTQQIGQVFEHGMSAVHGKCQRQTSTDACHWEYRNQLVLSRTCASVCQAVKQMLLAMAKITWLRFGRNDQSERRIKSNEIDSSNVSDYSPSCIVARCHNLRGSNEAFPLCCSQ